MEAAMGQLIVRDLDDALIRRLKERAAKHGISMEAEHRRLLEESLAPAPDSFFARAAALRAETRGTVQTDSAELLRADRDRDHLPPE
jgi:plasmid stability protein